MEPILINAEAQVSDEQILGFSILAYIGTDSLRFFERGRSFLLSLSLVLFDFGNTLLAGIGIFGIIIRTILRTILRIIRTIRFLVG
jgi:hypothetical protein